MQSQANSRIFILSAFCRLSICVFVGCGGEPAGYHSPQAAFDALQAAFKTEDFGAAFDTLTPEAQQYETGRAVQGCGLAKNQVAELPDDAPLAVKRAQEHVAQQLELLARYNVSLDGVPDVELLSADRMELGRRVRDRRGFYVEFWQSFTDYVRFLNDDPVPWDRPFVLENLVIDGDQASADKVPADIDGVRITIELAFERINGRWYVDTTKTGW